MKFATFFILLFTMIVPRAGNAADEGYVLKGDLLVTSVGYFRTNASKMRRLCLRVGAPLANKTIRQADLSEEFRGNPNYILTDEEYVKIVGDVPGFILGDFSDWFIRAEQGANLGKGLWEYLDLSKLETGIYDDIPMVCGHNLGPVKTLATGASTKPASIANFFLIDRHGVDQISSDGWSLGNGTAVREFGTISTYLPGDMTREVGWKPKEQTLLMYESIKHNRTNEVEIIRKDALSLTFQVDSERTEAAGGMIIWRATEEPSNGEPVCARWEREMSPETCREKKKNSREFYLTAGIDQAKEIFKELSPNARMIGRDDSSENCVSGSICEYPGGDYVDAIIRGDMQRFRQLDLTASGFMRDKIAQLGIIGERFFAPYFDDEALSPLSSFVNEYLHEYKKNPSHCFKPGSQSFDFKATTDTLVEVDGIGNRTGNTYGGITLTSSYRINPEFFGMCEQVCGVRNGGIEQIAGSTDVLLAVREFRKTYDCKSKEVQDFERNLIDFYSRRDEVYDFEITRNSW